MADSSTRSHVKRRPGYLVAHVAESPKVKCPCGLSTRILTRADTSVCNVHVTEIRNARKHYHKKCTEVYFILEGYGILELNQDRVNVGPGSVVLIEPGTRHRLLGNVRTIVFGVPPLEPDDEYFDNPR